MNYSPVLEQDVHGLVHLYSGDGKGKSTAAIGLAVRAVGHGKKILFCQFLKGAATGELEPLKRLGVDLLRAQTSEKFLFQMDSHEKEQTAGEHLRCFEKMRSLVFNNGYELVVLDEITSAVNTGLIPSVNLTNFITERPRILEVVLTGRNPPAEICALADYHTDFQCIQHPYLRSIPSRPGIEY